MWDLALIFIIALLLGANVWIWRRYERALAYWQMALEQRDTALRLLNKAIAESNGKPTFEVVE